MQEITNMHDNITAVVDISDFQKNLNTVFETKGVLSQFKNENIPAPKKSVAVNEAKVKTDNKKEVLEDSKELIDALKREYNKFKINNKEDNDFKKEVDNLALKLAENPANENLQVINHEEIASFLKSKNKRVCWSCRLTNCLTRQICSSKLKIKKRFLGKCEGKRITFKQLKEQKPSTPTATAQITTPAPANAD